MKIFLIVIFGLSVSFDWLNDARIDKEKIDLHAKLTRIRQTKSTCIETFRFEKFKKTTFRSNRYNVTDTISRSRYMKGNFVFCVREWYVSDYQSKGKNPKEWPIGEVYEAIYLFRNPDRGVMLERRERYHSKDQVDSLIKTLEYKHFDTLQLNYITYERIRSKRGRMVKLRFK
jgi:hypothetical protein